MTLLEIMIVLAILALVMGLVVGPKIFETFITSKHDIAKLAVRQYADQDFPMWAAQHPETPCPASLMVLVHSATPPLDPWGTPYKDYCPPTASVAFGAASFGTDRTEATTDDIRSWE